VIIFHEQGLRVND